MLLRGPWVITSQLARPCASPLNKSPITVPRYALSCALQVITKIVGQLLSIYLESDLVQELDQLKSAHEQLQVQYQELSQQSKAGAENDEQSEAVAHLTQQLQQANQDLAGQRAKTMALQQVLL